MSRWQREHPLMLSRCAHWVAEIERMFPERGRATFALDPGSEPAPGVPWNWFLSFEVGGTGFQALVAEDLAGAAFEDRDGRFDDHVELDGVPSYVRRRLC